MTAEELYEVSPYKNLCTICGIDLGYNNPRQYCGKTYCPQQFEYQDKKDYKANSIEEAEDYCYCEYYINEETHEGIEKTCNFCLALGGVCECSENDDNKCKLCEIRQSINGKPKNQ